MNGHLAAFSQQEKPDLAKALPTDNGADCRSRPRDTMKRRGCVHWPEQADRWAVAVVENPACA